jgi:pantothenate kinase
LGLSRLISGTNDFDKVLEMSNEGENQRVDLYEADIFQGQIEQVP